MNLIPTLAAGIVLLAGTSAEAHDSRDKSHNSVPSAGRMHPQHDYGPAIHAEPAAYDWGDDGTVAFAAPDGSSYSYDGDWEGQFIDPEGRVFEGEWQGTVTRHGGVPDPGYSAGPRPRRQVGVHHPMPDHRVPTFDKDYDDYLDRQGYQHQGHVWQSGYYYYPQASVTVISAAPYTTTTVTEEVYDETVHAAPAPHKK